MFVTNTRLIKNTIPQFDTYLLWGQNRTALSQIGVFEYVYWQVYSHRPLWTQTIFEYLSKDVLSPATVNPNNFLIFKYRCTFTCWVFSLTQINIFCILRVYVAFAFSKIVKCSLSSVFCLLSTSVYCLLFKVNCQCHCMISAYTVYVFCLLSTVFCLLILRYAI